jgi:hypothetical protein
MLFVLGFEAPLRRCLWLMLWMGLGVCGLCMFDKIIKKMIIVLHSNQQIFFLPPKIRSSNLKGK